MDESEYTCFEPDYYALSMHTYRRYHDQRGMLDIYIEGSTPEKMWEKTDPGNERSIAYVVNEWKKERGLKGVSTKIRFDEEGTPACYRVMGTVLDEYLYLALAMHRAGCYFAVFYSWDKKKCSVSFADAKQTFICSGREKDLPPGIS